MNGVKFNQCCTALSEASVFNSIRVDQLCTSCAPVVCFCYFIVHQVGAVFVAEQTYLAHLNFLEGRLSFFA